MAHIKTAISLRESLLKEVDDLANELKISRSRLFSLAVEAYLQKYQNQSLLDALNAAYEDHSDPNEQSVQQKIRPKHKRLIEGEW